VKKRKIVALTKTDIYRSDDMIKMKKIKFGRGVRTLAISSITGDGVRDLIDEMWKLLASK
jgi:50S ribosomal subunit-associated GTPase HflX